MANRTFIFSTDHCVDYSQSTIIKSLTTMEFQGLMQYKQTTYNPPISVYTKISDMYAIMPIYCICENTNTTRYKKLK